MGLYCDVIAFKMSKNKTIDYLITEVKIRVKGGPVTI